LLARNWIAVGMRRSLGYEREAFALMLVEKSNFSVQRMARLLEVSRSGYYTRFHGESDEVSGSPKMLADLREDGEVISRKTVAKFATDNGITRSMGLTGIFDNAMAESFFATLKTEFYHRRVWPGKNRAKLEVRAWIEAC